MSLLILYAFKGACTLSLLSQGFTGTPQHLWELGGCASSGTVVPLGCGFQTHLSLQHGARSWAVRRQGPGQRLNGCVGLGAGVRGAKCAQENLCPPACVQSAPGRHHLGARWAWNCPGAASIPVQSTLARGPPRPPSTGARLIIINPPLTLLLKLITL